MIAPTSTTRFSAPWPIGEASGCRFGSASPTSASGFCRAEARSSLTPGGGDQDGWDRQDITELTEAQHALSRSSEQLGRRAAELGGRAGSDHGPRDPLTSVELTARQRKFSHSPLKAWQTGPSQSGSLSRRPPSNPTSERFCGDSRPQTVPKPSPATCEKPPDSHAAPFGEVDRRAS